MYMCVVMDCAHGYMFEGISTFAFILETYVIYIWSKKCIVSFPPKAFADVLSITK